MKSLDINGSRRDRFKVSGWAVLIERARKKPLLPNLRSLIIGTPPDFTLDSNYSFDQLAWTMAFASPSLTAFSIPLVEVSPPPLLSYRGASAILETLTQHKPNLRELTLYPESGLGYYHEDGESNLLMFLSGEPFHHYLVGLNQLRHLTGSISWLKPQQRLVLSRLPLLETITIYSSFDTAEWDEEIEVLEAPEPPEPEPPEVPAYSFPSLRRLSMYDVRHSDMIKVLRASYMFRHITHLDVDFHVFEPHLEEPIDAWMIGDFFPVFSHMPCLCDLRIKIFRSDDEEPLWVLSAAVLEIFSVLPLQSVTLCNMGCPFLPWPHNFEIAWSLVTKLCMPDQTLALDTLIPFTTLPKLEYLELRLDVIWLYDPVEPEPGPRAPLHTLVSTYNEPDVDDKNFSNADEIAL